jgi:putative acetyltransferase
MRATAGEGMAPGEALSPPLIRAGRDGDAADLIRLVGDCFAEYPGCVLDVDGEIPELRAIATWAESLGGRFWVAECDGRVVGCVGVTPGAAPASVELRKLYVAAAARRRGLGAALCALVEDEARRRGARSVELWSDTRFADAHRLYQRRGYRRTGETRDLHDLSDTTEFRFEKRL